MSESTFRYVRFLNLNCSPLHRYTRYAAHAGLCGIFVTFFIKIINPVGIQVEVINDPPTPPAEGKSSQHD
jgi:hypothetical protein